MAKILQFQLTTAASPWKTRQTKAIYTTIRLAMRCDSVVWLEDDGAVPANVSTKIFAYMKSGDEYLFNHVCSAVDLLELPETEGEDWLRKDTVDVLVPSIEIANESKDKLESDIHFLAREVASYTSLVGLKESEVS